MQRGELYRLRRPRARAERRAVRPRRRVVVLGYEPHRSLDSGSRLVVLQGLDPAADYELGESGVVLSGETLMTRGLELLADLHRSPRNDTLQFSARDYLSSLTELRVRRTSGERA